MKNSATFVRPAMEEISSPPERARAGSREEWHNITGGC